MKKLLTIIAMLICCASFAQPNTDAVFKTIKAKGSFTLGTKKINAILNDTTLVDSSAVPTCRAVRDFVVARVVAGGSLIPNFPIAISGDTISINYADRFNDGVINAAAYRQFEDDSTKWNISGVGYRTKGDKPIAIGDVASSLYSINVTGAIRYNGIMYSTDGNNKISIINPGMESVFLGDRAGNITFTQKYNTGIGQYCMFNLTSGERNTCGGKAAGYNITTGSNNTLFGNNRTNVSTGNNNTEIGGSSGAGIGATSGNGNISIGANVSPAVPTADNQLNIGNWIRGREEKIGINTNDSSERFVINGNLKLLTAGDKILIATGSNASIGTATLSGGTITVSTTAVTSSSKIFISYSGTPTNPGYITTTNIVNGTSFDIVSSSGTDGSAVNWWIIN